MPPTALVLYAILKASWSFHLTLQICHLTCHMAFVNVSLFRQGHGCTPVLACETFLKEKWPYAAATLCDYLSQKTSWPLDLVNFFNMSCVTLNLEYACPEFA